MDIIFCLSYLSVPDTINIIEKNKASFKVATSNSNIKKLFEELYSEEVIWFIEKPKLSKKHPLKSLLNIKKAKKRMLDQISLYEGNQIYAFFISYCFFEAWMVKKLSEYNTVFYKPAVSLDTHDSYDWTGLLKKYLIKLTYGIDTSFNLYGEIYRPIIDHSYLEKVNAKIIKPTTNIQFVKDRIRNKLQIDETDILLLVGSIVEMDFVSESNYRKEMDQLLMNLRNQGYKVHLKIHPRFNQLFSLEKEFPQIPSYLPANLILDEFNFVMGYSTSTLFEAANDGKRSISLLNYFSSKSERKAKDAITYLKGNLDENKEIYFPNNLDDILKLLKKNSCY